MRVAVRGETTTTGMEASTITGSIFSCAGLALRMMETLFTGYRYPTPQGVEEFVRCVYDGYRKSAPPWIGSSPPRDGNRHRTCR